MKKVVLIGDSLRLHYQPLVIQELANEAIVLGPLPNCRSSTDILTNAKDWILDSDPDIVHINCGMHDLRIDPPGSVHQVSIEKYAENLDEIFSLICNDKKRVLIWATLTPLNEQRHQLRRPARRYESDVDLYNAAATNVAQKHGARINDLRKAILAAGPDHLLGPDGVHFTEEGYAVLAREVVAAIRHCL